MRARGQSPWLYYDTAYAQTANTTVTASSTQPYYQINLVPESTVRADNDLPESNVAWLRRRVSEITDLVAA